MEHSGIAVFVSQIRALVGFAFVGQPFGCAQQASAALATSFIFHRRIFSDQ